MRGGRVRVQLPQGDSPVCPATLVGGFRREDSPSHLPGGTTCALLPRRVASGLGARLRGGRLGRRHVGERHVAGPVQGRAGVVPERLDRRALGLEAVGDLAEVDFRERARRGQRVGVAERLALRGAHAGRDRQDRRAVLLDVAGRELHLAEGVEHLQQIVRGGERRLRVPDLALRGVGEAARGEQGGDGVVERRHHLLVQRDRVRDDALAGDPRDVLHARADARRDALVVRLVGLVLVADHGRDELNEPDVAVPLAAVVVLEPAPRRVRDAEALAHLAAVHRDQIGLHGCFSLPLLGVIVPGEPRATSS